MSEVWSAYGLHRAISILGTWDSLGGGDVSTSLFQGTDGREASKTRELPTSGPEGIAEMDSLAVETLDKLEAENPDKALRMEDTLLENRD